MKRQRKNRTSGPGAFSRDLKGSALLHPVPVCVSGRCPTSRGMTLVEDIVASVLVGVAVAGLMFAASLGLRNQQRSHLRMAALYLAQEKLAEIEAVGPRLWSLAESSRGTETRRDVTYEWSLQVEPMSDGELFDVQVEVSWLASGGGGKVELETLLNDYRAATAMHSEQRDRRSPLEAHEAPAG